MTNASVNKEVKVTKKERFNQIFKIIEKSNVKDKDELLKFISHEIELVTKKSSTGKTSKAAQDANNAIKEKVLEVLKENGKALSIAELMADDRLSSYFAEEKGVRIEKTLTNQKLTYVLSRMKDEGTIVRTVVKKKSYYELPKVE